MAVESIVQAVLAEVSKSIVEKIRRGKRLSIEEILLLYLDLMHTQIGGLREEIRETNKRIDHIYQDLLSKIDQVYRDLSKKIDETNRRIDETNKRIDMLYQDILSKIDQVYKDLSQRIDETNRRIDRLYEATTQRRDE